MTQSPIHPRHKDMAAKAMEQVKAEPVACPCCGGETSMQEDHWRDGNLRGGEPFCRDCGLKMPRYWPRRKSDPTSAWNHRTTPQPAAVDGLVDALAKRAFVMKEPHLSGYRICIGFEHEQDSWDAFYAISQALTKTKQP